MHPLNILKFSQSKFIKTMDRVLPFLALAVAVYYFFVAGSMTMGWIWVATAALSAVLTVANLTRWMMKLMLPNLARKH